LVTETPESSLDAFLYYFIFFFIIISASKSAVPLLHARYPVLRRRQRIFRVPRPTSNARAYSVIFSEQSPLPIRKVSSDNAFVQTINSNAS